MLRNPCFGPQSSFWTITFIFSNLFLHAWTTIVAPNLNGDELQWFLCSRYPTAHHLGKWSSFHPSPTCRGIWTSWLLPKKVQIFLLSESKWSLCLFLWGPDCDREWKLVVLLFRMILFQASQKAMPITNPCVALFSSGNVALSELSHNLARTLPSLTAALGTTEVNWESQGR